MYSPVSRGLHCSKLQKTTQIFHNLSYNQIVIKLLDLVQNNLSCSGLNITLSPEGYKSHVSPQYRWQHVDASQGSSKNLTEGIFSLFIPAAVHHQPQPAEKTSFHRRLPNFADFAEENWVMQFWSFHKAKNIKMGMEARWWGNHVESFKYIE